MASRYYQLLAQAAKIPTALIGEHLAHFPSKTTPGQDLSLKGANFSLSRTGEVCGLRNASVEREYGNQPTNEFEEFLPVDLYNFETEDNDDGFGGLRSFELRF